MRRLGVLFLFVGVGAGTPSPSITDSSSLPVIHHQHPSSSCSYTPPKIHEVLPVIDLGEKVVTRTKRQTSAPLRIKYFYHNESISKLDAEKFRLVDEQILPQAVDYWSRNLRPRYPLGAPVILNRRCPEDKVFFLSGKSDQYCRETCEEVSLCGEVEVPKEHLGPCRVCDSTGRSCHVEDELQTSRNGVHDVDFVLYVSAIEGEKCRQGETIAYAVHCQQETLYDRPIAGHANLCPSTLISDAQHIRTLLSTVKHEVLHALGFSVSLFAFFRDDAGDPLTFRSPATGRPEIDQALMIHRWSDKIVKATSQPWMTTSGIVNKTRHFLVTPRVVNAVREHFNCPTLIGGELEDQGDDGTRLTHWEKRLFENEAMTGTNTQNPVYSKMTFALMEDTGWYWVEKEGHDPLNWGRGLGCEFTRMSCLAWMESRKERGEPIYPYCDQVKRNPLKTTCTDSRNAIALCNLVQYANPLPKEYQYFHSIDGIGGDYAASFGSSVALADYCPFVQEFTWANSGRNSDCSFEVNQPTGDKNFALEGYGKGSLCFHTGKWKESTCSLVRQWHHWGSACYKHSCRNGSLDVIIHQNITLSCYYEGQKIYVKVIDDDGWLHASHIICPSCEDVCGAENCNLDNGLDFANTIDDSPAMQSLKCGSPGGAANALVVGVALCASAAAAVGLRSV